MTFSTSNFNTSSTSFKTYCQLSGVLAMSGLTVISLGSGVCAEALDATDDQLAASAIHLDTAENLPLQEDVRPLVAEAVLPETKAVEPIADVSLEAFPATGHRAISRALRDSAAAWASEQAMPENQPEPVAAANPMDVAEVAAVPLVGATADRSMAELLVNDQPVVAAAPAPGAAPAAEPKKWGVGVRAQASTLGFFGVDAGYKFSNNFHARLGFDLGSAGYNTSNSGVDYDANLNLSNVHLLGDYFPFGGGLRLTGGLIVQGNRLSGNAKPTAGGQINLNGQNYTLGSAVTDQINGIGSEAAFGSSVAPYLGIGFGTPISPGLSFNADLGVMFPGSPSVKLSPRLSPNLDPAVASQITNDVREQEAKTNRDIAGFSVYPVLSIGFSYAF
jgi:hypothetical protein